MDVDNEIFICIWLLSPDKHLAEQEKLSIEKFNENLLSIKVFDDSNKCLDEISLLVDRFIFLRLGQQQSHFVKIIKEFDQIKCIYLSEKLEDEFDSRVRGVFISINDLCKQLRKDIRLYENDMTYLSTSEDRIYRKETSTRNVEQEGKNIFWFETLLRILITMPSNRNEVYENLFNAARHRNRSQQTIDEINRFKKDYKTEHALVWFTKDSFLHKIINQALRTQNIVIIFKFRSIIADLCNHLKSLQYQQKDSLKNIRLYRGQRIALTEFERLKQNVNGRVSLNTFTSTSMDRTVGIRFLNTEQPEDNFQWIIFEYRFDPNISLADLPSFANISQISSMGEDEEEVLLSPGTVARIEDCSPDKDYPNVYIVRLRIELYQDPLLNDLQVSLLNSIPSDAEETSYIMQLCPILCMLGQEEKAIQLITSVPKSSNNIFESLRSYFTLRNIRERSLANNASDSFASKALRFQSFYERFFAENQQIDEIAPEIRTFLKSYMGILNSLSTNEQNESTLFTYRDMCTHLLKQTLQSLNPVHLSNERPFYYPMMENAFVSKLSLKQEQTTWNELPPISYKTLFGKHHSYKRWKLSVKAFQAHQKGCINRAIRLYKEALKISHTDDQRAQIFLSLGHLYEHKKKWSKIFLYCLKLLKLSNLPPNSLEIIRILSQTGNTLCLMKKYKEALKFYRYARCIFDEHHSENHSTMRKELTESIACIRFVIFAKSRGIIFSNPNK